MTDPRIVKLAKVLVHYSLNLKEGEKVAIQSNHLATPLNLAVYKEALLAGAHPNIFVQTPGTTEILFKYGTDTQISNVSPVQKLVIEEFEALLSIWASDNTRALSGVQPEKQATAAELMRHCSKDFLNGQPQGKRAGVARCFLHLPKHKKRI